MSFISLFRKIFGSRNQRILKQLEKSVIQINALEAEYEQLSDEQLKSKTDEFRERLQKGQTLDSLLPEAFAVVREAGKRVLNMRIFDVQLLGGMALHQGKIAEMHTGEGKTLVGTLPVYLNALPGRGVHIVTVNDYLAKRDAAWMGPIFEFLGLTVGVIYADMSKPLRQEAYAADITYGTNNEFGFDYLRDNMAFSKEERVQRELTFAVIDEVDSILIDEARTPLIISGPTEDNSDLYVKIDKLIPKLIRQVDEEADEGDYTVDEKTRQVFITETGHDKVEQILVEEGLLQSNESLYDTVNIGLLHHVNAALRAHALFTKDVDYIVRHNEVIIVDEHTGRTMPGRRWSDGLHQAVEAKEGVNIKNENQTLASITFQNYFRLYAKLAGMTGTADTEAFEFQHIYGLEVVVIPTNKPNIRDDAPDYVFLTVADKFNAVILDIKDCLKRKQPVLVGTASIETSEILSNLLKKEKIKHSVLNAKFHEQEAQIIAQAGMPGVVTIATNMAGRGTDIVLGGNLEAEISALNSPTEEQLASIKEDWQKRQTEVIAAGGIHVIGSERHESRRIDNQLRGRSGRQGDPGSTRFYLSLEDNLMRIFASPTLAGMMKKLGMAEGEAIESTLVTKAISNAQRKVEGRNFDIRKQLLQFDDVANEQRKIIYEQRNDMMELDDISDYIQSIRKEVIEALFDEYVPPQSIEEQWDIAGLMKQLDKDFGLVLPVDTWLKEDESMQREALFQRIYDSALEQYQEKEALASSEVVRRFEKAVMLQYLDMHWKEHLAAMDYLRNSINLRGYAQKDPKQEYKREAYLLFKDLLDKIKYEVVSVLSRFQVKAPDEVQALEEKRRHALESAGKQYQHASMSILGQGSADDIGDTTAQGGPQKSVQPAGAPVTFIRETRKIGRNEPCHCGSGKKYKHCHGALTEPSSDKAEGS